MRSPCSCSPITSRSPRAPTSISRATSPNRSRSNSRAARARLIPQRLRIGAHRLLGRGATRAGGLREHIMAVVDRDRFDETVANPRNIFEHRRRRMPERQMDVDLPHVADMRDHRQAPPVRTVRHPDNFGVNGRDSGRERRVTYGSLLGVYVAVQKINNKITTKQIQYN